MLLSVRDLDISWGFYRDVLGLEVFVEPFEATAFDGRETMLRAGRVVICLQAHRANDGSTFAPTRTGLDHLAFHLSTRRQLEEWDRHLDDLDVAHSPIKPAARFGSMIELRDPNNTQIELFAPARDVHERRTTQGRPLPNWGCRARRQRNRRSHLEHSGRRSCRVMPSVRCGLRRGQTLGHPRLARGRHHLAEVPDIAAGSVLAPQMMTPTRSSRCGVYAPDVRAAYATEPPGSAMIRLVSHRCRCAVAASSSVTKTLS